MKKLIATGITLAALSVAGNIYNVAGTYGDYEAERNCARDLNVFACDWTLAPVTQPAEPEKLSSVDPIGDMIAAAVAAGMPTPPKVR